MDRKYFFDANRGRSSNGRICGGPLGKFMEAYMGWNYYQHKYEIWRKDDSYFMKIVSGEPLPEDIEVLFILKFS
jgi:hypothetical protein